MTSLGSVCQSRDVILLVFFLFILATYDIVWGVFVNHGT